VVVAAEGGGGSGDCAAASSKPRFHTPQVCSCDTRVAVQVSCIGFGHEHVMLMFTLMQQTHSTALESRTDHGGVVRG
jgi:hypothetical protein